MPRPTDITAEELQEWRRCYAQDRAAQAAFPRLRHFSEEAFLAAEWLWRELGRQGADDGTARRVCFANGQRLAAAPPAADPWEIAAGSLARWAAGTPDVPGEALAEQLLREQVGELTPAAILAYLAEQGLDWPAILQRESDALARKLGRLPTWAELRRELEERLAELRAELRRREG